MVMEGYKISPISYLCKALFILPVQITRSCCMCVCVCVSVCLSVCLSVYLSICLYIDLSIRPPVWLSVYIKYEAGLWTIPYPNLRVDVVDIFTPEIDLKLFVVEFCGLLRC
jgi:hypothetical protein